MPYKPTLVLYHWTHYTSCITIDKEGLKAESSEGAYRRVWMCSREQVFPVLYHLAQVKGVPAEDFRLYLVKADGLVLGKTSVPGRYWTVLDVVPESLVRSLAWPMCLTLGAELFRHSHQAAKDRARKDPAAKGARPEGRKGSRGGTHTKLRGVLPPGALDEE